MIKYLSIMAVALLCCASANGQLRVSDLRVEHMENPTVVDLQTTPRFSWINLAKPNERGQRQTAYQIVVASSAQNLKKKKYDVWDSGKQMSEESNLVSYGGPALQSGKDYFWQVRTWNQQNKPSAWSAVGMWGMGLKAEQWKADWICSQQTYGGAPMLCKTFTPRDEVRQAKIYISGLGYFELYVNGQRIGKDCLVPNVSDYGTRNDLGQQPIALDNKFRDSRVLYMAYDVTNEIYNGKNMLGVILGNGFYHPDKAIASTYGERPVLRCQLHLTLKDGSQQVIYSDPTWLSRPSPIKYNGIYKGELYDARTYLSDWCNPYADTDGWKKVLKAKGPDGKMTAMTSPADKVTETLSPVSLKKVAEKTWEVAFEKEIAGWIRFKNLVGKRGDTLRVDFHCESPQGTEQYIFAGAGREKYAPRFTWFVFSKATIHGVEELSEEDIFADAVNTDVPVSSEFRTSNPLFNRINEIWQRSQLDNMHGCIASDCPHRERLPYTGDGEATCETVMLNFDAAAFYQKWIRDIRDAQNVETGYVPNCAPWQPGAGGGVAWGVAMNTMPWQYYLEYGDKRMLEDSYPCMKEQLRHMQSWLTEDGIMHQQKCNFPSGEKCYWLNLGDWCPPGDMPRDELVHTFHLWLAADYTARAARALGKEDEAKTYQQLADKVADAFHTHFYDAEHRTYGEAGSNIYALRMGVPGARRQDVVETLRKEIMEKNHGHINTGFVATKYFFETLSDCGLHNVAYYAMNQRDFPSYGWWIEQGATVTWERWDGEKSRNHPMFGSGLTWFYRRLGGINTDEAQPGYRNIIIRPTLTSQLADIQCAHRTPYGRVATHLTHLVSGKHQLQVEVPVGSTATVILPGKGTITESGNDLTRALGVSDVERKDGNTILRLAQGSYSLTF